MTYTTKYATTDISHMVVDILGTGVNATISWIDLLVLLAVVGIIVSILMGILFKISRIMGLG